MTPRHALSPSFWTQSTTTHCRIPATKSVGTLLDGLYPTALTPSQVWRYALSGDRPVSLGRLWHFWEVTLMERSRDQHVAELLDALHEDASRLIPAMEESQFADLPLRLLERGLEALGDDIEPSRLYNWLSATGRCLGTSSPTEESARRVRAWLEARREVQQAVFLMWLRKRNQIDRSWPNGYWRCEALHESRLPADFGLWCFEQALAIGDTEPAVSQELLEQAHQSLQRPIDKRGPNTRCHARADTWTRSADAAARGAFRTSPFKQTLIS